MEQINFILEKISAFLWGIPLLIALIGTGLFLTIRLGFVQFRYMPKALKMIFMPPHDKTSPVEISHFQALMTALAATVGTGNIAGVGTAIAMGGPGAMLWMWITGLVGMATKYSEAVLAIRYRVIHKDGTVAGGPMYYIEHGLKSKVWAMIFAICISIAAFGTGNMIQSNSVAEAMNGAFGFPKYQTGFVISLLAGLVIIGGIKSIGRVTQIIVPFMILLYMAVGVIAICKNMNTTYAGEVLLPAAPAWKAMSLLHPLKFRKVKNAIRSAGDQFVTTGTIDPATTDIIATPLITKEQYVNAANNEFKKVLDKLD